MKNQLKQSVVFTLIASLLAAYPSVSFAQAPAQAPPAAAPGLGAAVGLPDEDPWPRVLQFEGNTIKIYQPQIQSWAGNVLDAYGAVAVKSAAGNTDYGVIFFTASTEVDKVNRIVTLFNLNLTKQNFPTLTGNGSQFTGSLKELHAG